MKPVNDKYFGSGSGKISVSYHNGSGTVTGYIVKQVGTSSFIVTDGSTTRRVRLAQTTATAATLTDGFMRIAATGGGSGATFAATYEVDTVTVLAGGTGYAVSNVLTGVGANITPFTVTVATVSTGAVTGITITNRGEYSTVPGTLNTNVRQVTTTGGAGTGATLNITFRIKSITVSSGGTGYLVGQTITNSGLGGTQPNITIASVDATTGAVLTLTVVSPGASIFTFASAFSGEPSTLYVKRLDSHKAHMTSGNSYSWRMFGEPDTSGYAILSTI